MVFARSFFRNEQGDDPPPAHVAAQQLPAKPEPCAAGGSPAPPSKHVQRALRPVSYLAHDVGIDHGGFHILVAQQLLHFADIHTRHQ